MAVKTRLSFLIFTNAAYLTFQPKTEFVLDVRRETFLTWNVMSTMTTWNVAGTFTTTNTW